MKIKKIILYIIEMVILVGITTFVFKNVLLPVQVDGKSMYPTLDNSDTAIINALNIDKEHIKRFDIVVLKIENVDKNIVKRVIGLPGETIRYTNDRLYINDVYFEEFFLDKKYIDEIKEVYNATTFTEDFTVVVEDDGIFVLGDNRLKSSDSRTYGSFKYEEIVGKKGMVIFPFKNMKWME